MHSPKRSPAIVLGAGFQGVCAALALEARGYRVTLVDRAPGCMLRASAVNEGKIHLGFIYANDPTFHTSRLLLHAGLAFAPEIDALAGQPLDWSALRLRPFTYGILRDTLLAPERILACYERLQREYEAIRAAAGRSYLGTTPRRLWNDAAPPRSAAPLNRDEVIYTIDTVEAPVDLPRLRSVLRAAVEAREHIERLYLHQVCEVARTAAGFCVGGLTADGEGWAREGAIVVNCLWDRRMAVDRQLGITPHRKWVYRLKYRMLGELPPALAGLPSLTFVLGRFGDIVVNPRGLSYFSWYPVCLRGWSTELAPPPEWEAAIGGHEPPGADSIARDILHGFEPIIPGIAATRPHSVSGGVIFSWGETDIDDLSSELHNRYDIGVHAHDGYFSIDTGKFTCAPLFARELIADL